MFPFSSWLFDLRARLSFTGRVQIFGGAGKSGKLFAEAISFISMEQYNVQAVVRSKFPFDKTDTKPQLQHSKEASMPWIQTAKGHPYFFTDRGEPWTPIGQNDAITWPELNGLFRRKDTASAEQYISMLAQKGVTCMRLMLEYCQGKHRFIEKPVGHFPPNMVQLWDDIFALCEKYKMRILLTPYDTLWMWIRWKDHPYSKANGGICSRRNQWLLCRDTRAAIKRRFLFATERWGGSGALFAWDLWNEIHPAHSGDSAEAFAEFVEDISHFVRKTEIRLYGRAHPQTVSVFGPVLNSHPLSIECTFRHPELDFASVHFYESKTIDNPKNTVDAAISTGRLTKNALAEIKDNRPFFDSEHGPIHAFKDKHRILPEPFDDEYFRHMQWAHFASGGAGGGMRWPNRHPHSLTTGMREAQFALSKFLPLVQWQQFRRQNWNDLIRVSDKAVHPFGCGDEQQAIVWLLRRDTVLKNGMLKTDVPALKPFVYLPMRKKGRYSITIWDTKNGVASGAFWVQHDGENDLCLHLPVVTDLALSVRREH